jgi:hypothetical protein
MTVVDDIDLEEAVFDEVKAALLKLNSNETMVRIAVEAAMEAMIHSGVHDGFSTFRDEVDRLEGLGGLE